MGLSVEVRDLSVCRGSFCMSDVSFGVNAGEVFAILGQTGSGKTILLEAIAGAFPLDKGQVLIDGKDAANLVPGNRGIAVVFQDYALFPHLTVLENVRYGLDRAKVPRQEATQKALETLGVFGIEHLADRYPGTISGGEAQRTALSRALVLQPSILLMDEPFAAVDPATKRRMYRTINEVKKTFGCTIIFVTHDFNEAQTLADHVGVVLEGQLRMVCESQALFDCALDSDVRYFLGLDEDGSAA